MAFRLRFVAVLLLATTVACTKRTAVVTSTELQGGVVSGAGWIREELYFGMNIPTGGVVTDSAFDAFAKDQIATRLPDGFTILNSIGYWRSPQTSRAEWEEGKVLIVHYRESDRAKPRGITEIIALYKRMFAQESVLRVALPAKVQFQ